MPGSRFLKHVLACLFFCAALPAAEPDVQAAATAPNAGWLELVGQLPVVDWFTSRPAPPAVCNAAPLPAIDDPDALRFESGIEPTSTIDVGSLIPAMARALERFRQMVTSAGGTFDLKSAYRPPAYQAHLQEVWFKRMELRNNREPGCQGLRSQVEDEFTRHHLLETQKPVTSSDHTRGLAFDAVVILPKPARLRKRTVTLDRLALAAGIKRPDILRDPVHFKLADGRAVRVKLASRRAARRGRTA